MSTPSAERHDGPERNVEIGRIVDGCRRHFLDPSQIPVAQIVAEYPHLQPELEAELRRLVAAAGGAAAHGDEKAIDSTLPFLQPPTVAKANPADDSAHKTLDYVPRDTPSLAPAQRILYLGDYEVLEEIAHGGMGVVYRARQVSLNRIVALKMIKAGSLASREEIERFHTEAKAAANLNHVGIVKIYEVGEHAGLHYFSMEHIAGRGLDAVVAGGPLASKQAANYLRDVARALAYAHEQGVLHRDIKPSNILIDEADKVHVTDFGLAKRRGDSNLTISGQVLGTPSYMSPEQAQAQHDQMGPTSDVYSLGALLYALVTGRPPFQADSTHATLLQVIELEPVGPRLLNPGIDRDLETICLKCLEKTPARRYASAGELADELERFLTGRPILARPVSPGERARRWCLRNRPLAASLAATFLAIIIGSLVSVVFGIQARHEATLAANREFSERQAKLEVKKLADHNQSLADSNARAAAEQKSLRWSAEYEVATALYENAAAKYQAGDVAHSLLLAARGVELADTLSQQQAGLEGLPRTPPDVSRLRRAFVNTYNASSGESVPITHLFECPQPPRGISFIHDGRTLVAAVGSEIHQWDVSARFPEPTILKTDFVGQCAAVSPSGEQMILGNERGDVQIWNLVTKSLQKTLHRDNLKSQIVGISNNGARAYARAGGLTVFWDLNDANAAPKTASTFGGPPVDGYFAANRTHLAGYIRGQKDIQVHVWNQDTAELASPPFTIPWEYSSDLAFAADSSKIAVAGTHTPAREESIGLWNLADGKPLETAFKIGKESPRVMTFSPTGNYFAAFTLTMKLYLWRVSDGALLGVKKLPYPNNSVLAFVDGDRFLIGTGGSMHLFDAAEFDDPGRQYRFGNGLPNFARLVATDGHGRLAFASPQDNSPKFSLLVVDFSRDKPTVFPLTPQGKIGGMQGGLQHLPAKDQVLAMTHEVTNRATEIWDYRKSRRVCRIDHGKSDDADPTPSPSGKLVAVAFGPMKNRERKILVYDTETGEQLFDPIVPDLWAFDHWFVGEDLIAARLWDYAKGNAPPEIRKLWQLAASGRGVRDVTDDPAFKGKFNRPLRRVMQPGFEIFDVAPAAGRMLACQGNLGVGGVALLEWPQRRLVADFQAHDDDIQSITFSPDGSLFATGAGVARIWDGATAKPLSRDLRHAGRVELVAFSADGARLITGSDDNTIKEYDCRAIEGTGRTLADWTTALTRLTLDKEQRLQFVDLKAFHSLRHTVDAGGKEPLSWSVCRERLGRARFAPPSTTSPAKAPTP